MNVSDELYLGCPLTANMTDNTVCVNEMIMTNCCVKIERDFKLTKHLLC